MKMIAVIDEKFNKPIAVEMCMALRMKLEKHCGSSCDVRLYRAKEDIHSRRMSDIHSDLWFLLSECYVDVLIRSAMKTNMTFSWHLRNR